MHQMAQLRRQSITLIRLICPLIIEEIVYILASDSFHVLETRQAGQQGNATAKGAICTNGVLILRPIISLSNFFPMSSEILLTEDMDDAVTLEMSNHMPLL